MESKSERPVILMGGGLSTKAAWPLLAEDYDLAFYHPQAAQLAQEMRIEGAFNALQYGTPDDTEIAENAAAELTAGCVNAMPEIARRFRDIAGEDAPPEITERLAGWWPGYILHHARDLALRIAGLERLFRARRVVLCLVHEDVSPEFRGLVDWANSKGIPTVQVPHAPCHLLPGVEDIHRETRAVYIASSGDRMTEFYTESGHPAACIVTTGGPQWDALYEGGLPEVDEARRVLYDHNWGDVTDTPWIAYATTWAQTTSVRSEFGAELDAGLEAVIQVAKRKNAILMIKVHPHEGEGAEQAYANALNAAHVRGLVTRLHLSYVLRAADVLVAQGPSNLCIEAAILGTPACYIQTEGFDFRTPAYPWRSDAAGLQREVTGLLEATPPPEALENFVAQYNHGGGGAAERIRQMVRELCPITKSA